jgi:predicted  nucleic acid-binding Zn-ribbon protein
MTAAQESASPLLALLALQVHDAHIDQLRFQREHHPARVALNELLARHRKTIEKAAPIEAKVVEFDVRQGALEREVAESEARIATIEARLTAGAAGSYRDQGAMSEEIESLRRRMRHLEDVELEVMEEREPFDNDLAALRAEDGAIEEEARTQHGVLNAAEAELTSEIATADAERAALVVGIEPSLLAEYERLRPRLDGVAVARLEHGVCSGCNLALAAGELDRIHHAVAGERFHCEQCGRILVP